MRQLLTIYILLVGSLVTPSLSFVPHKTSKTSTKVGALIPMRRQKACPSRLDTSLEGSPLSSITPSLESLAVLAGVVLVHEAGHFLAARYYGMKVLEFSVGIGPKLLSFGKDIEFNLRALPFGGYVRFPNNYNSTLVDVPPEPVQEQKPFWNFFENKAKKKRQDEQRRKEAEDAKKQRPWWKMSEAEDNESGPKQEIQIEYDDDPDLLQNRPWAQRAVVLSNGVLFNILLAFSIYFGQLTVGNGLPKPVFGPGAVVKSIPATSNGVSNGVLRAGDIITNVNGAPLTQTKTPSAIASQKAVNDFISKIRETPQGETLQLTILRSMEEDEPKPLTVSVKPKPMSVDKSGNGQGPPSIGVMLTPNFVKLDTLRASSLQEAVVTAGKAVTEITTETAAGISDFFVKAVTGHAAGQQLSGPVGVIKAGSEVARTRDVAAIALFAAAISVNLAVINALPIPGLDGGQLVFVLAEALSGRKVDQQVQDGINSFAVLLLLFVSVSATIGDVGSIFGL